MLLSIATIATALALGAPDVDDDSVECGLHCLFLSLRALGDDDLTLAALRQQLGPPTPRGYSAEQLLKVASDRGFQGRITTTNLAELRQLQGRFACIAHMNGDHFVNIVNVDADHVEFVNKARWDSANAIAFDASWDGTALIISRGPLAVRSGTWLPSYLRITLIASLLGVIVLCVLFVGRRWRRGLLPLRQRPAS